MCYWWRTSLSQSKITNNNKYLYSFFLKDFKYLIYDLFDTGEQDMVTKFPATNEFIKEGIKEGGVIVHW